jgi:hypothetical protein
MKVQIIPFPDAVYERALLTADEECPLVLPVTRKVMTFSVTTTPFRLQVGDQDKLSIRAKNTVQYWK